MSRAKIQIAVASIAAAGAVAAALIGTFSKSGDSGNNCSADHSSQSTCIVNNTDNK